MSEECPRQPIDVTVWPWRPSPGLWTNCCRDCLSHRRYVYPGLAGPTANLGEMAMRRWGRSAGRAKTTENRGNPRCPREHGGVGRGSAVGCQRSADPVTKASTSAWGCTATSINVVFPIISFTSIEGEFEIESDAEYGEQTKAIHLFVNQINDAGGIHGRKINPDDREL